MPAVRVADTFDPGSDATGSHGRGLRRPNPVVIRRALPIVVAGLVVAACGSTTSGSGSSTSPSRSSSAVGSPSTALSTPPSPSIVTTTVTAAPTTQPAADARLFTGSWSGHGRSLVVTESGSINLTFRTYENCTATKTTGCDRTSGNQLTDGGRVTGRITGVTNGTTVTITVDTSTVPATFAPGATIRMGFDEGHDAIAVFAGGFANAPFCGAKSPSGYCGA